MKHLTKSRHSQADPNVILGGDCYCCYGGSIPKYIPFDTPSLNHWIKFSKQWHWKFDSYTMLYVSKTLIQKLNIYFCSKCRAWCRESYHESFMGTCFSKGFLWIKDIILKLSGFRRCSWMVSIIPNCHLPRNPILSFLPQKSSDIRADNK